jgi:hypothetical protein
MAGCASGADGRTPADGVLPAHDKHPTFVDLKAGMITGIGQRPGIIGCPRPGVFCQRDAHLPPSSSLAPGGHHHARTCTVNLSRRHHLSLAMLMPAIPSRSPACSTHIMRGPSWAVIKNRSVRFSANCRCSERRSGDGRTILGCTLTGLKSCPDLQFLVELSGLEPLTSCMPVRAGTSTDQHECSVTSKDTDGEQRGATHNNTRTHRFATQRATRRLAQ